MKLLKFTLTGGLATFVHYLIFALGTSIFYYSAAISSGIGALCGAIFSYVMNYFYTFNSSVNHSKSVALFSIMVFTGLFINTFILYIAVDVFQNNKWVFQIFATAVVFLWNFWLSKNWVFRNE